jgi:hypothetical protein
MIDYKKVKRGDILEITGAGAPGYAQNGDLVRVIETFPNAVKVEDREGKSVEFLYNCGAARLNVTEWTEDFPTSVDMLIKEGFCKYSDGVKCPTKFRRQADPAPRADAARQRDNAV